MRIENSLFESVALRGELRIENLHRFKGTTTQRSDDGDVASDLGDGSEHALQVVLVGQQGLAIDGEYQVAAVLNAVETGGTRPAVVVIAQGIHQDIAHHIDFVVLGTFARSNAAGAYASGKQQVADP